MRTKNLKRLECSATESREVNSLSFFVAPLLRMTKAWRRERSWADSLFGLLSVLVRYTSAVP